jgi:hypothetical protein
VIIHAYNDHVGSFLPSLWSSTTTVYSGLRSRRCYEITDSYSFKCVTLKGWMWDSVLFIASCGWKSRRLGFRETSGGLAVPRGSSFPAFVRRA